MSENLEDDKQKLQTLLSGTFVSATVKNCCHVIFEKESIDVSSFVADREHIQKIYQIRHETTLSKNIDIAGFDEFLSNLSRFTQVSLRVNLIRAERCEYMVFTNLEIDEFIGYLFLPQKILEQAS